MWFELLGGGFFVVVVGNILVKIYLGGCRYVYEGN